MPTKDISSIENLQLKFNIYGHENTLSKHKATIEFTHEDYLTKRGDCILGINSDFKFKKSELAKIHDKKILIEIKAGKIKDSFSCYSNPGFISEEEMVIRKSDFSEDNRTFAIRSNKAAIDINRKIVEYMTHPKSKCNVTIKKIKIKNLIFDFDNTLEDWTTAEVKTLKEIVKVVSKYYMDKKLIKEKITFTEFHDLYKQAKMYYVSHTKEPKYYARDYWLGFILKKLKIKHTKKELASFSEQYWKIIDANVELFPGAKETIKKLYKQGYSMYMYSDSDGTKEIKERRIKLFHIDGYFKGIYTSDDTGFNKPDEMGEQIMINMAHIDPNETAFIGDHPESDHLTSKKLGMSTIWIRKGFWSSRKETFPYVDFEIKEVPEVIDILKKLK